MGHSAGFGYALWAIAPNQLQSAAVHNSFFEKLAVSVKGTLMIKLYV
jgi:hypothetical protein